MVSKAERPTRHPDVPPEFVARFRELVRGTQPKALEPETIATYYEVLKTLHLDDVGAAVNVLLQKDYGGRFPSVGAWYEAAAAIAHRRRVVWQEPPPPADHVSPEEALRIIADLKHRLGAGGPRAMPAAWPPAKDEP